jgi:hypothetical protein
VQRGWKFPPHRGFQPPHPGFAAFDHLFPSNQMEQRITLPKKMKMPATQRFMRD